MAKQTLEQTVGQQGGQSYKLNTGGPTSYSAKPTYRIAETEKLSSDIESLRSIGKSLVDLSKTGHQISDWGRTRKADHNFNDGLVKLKNNSLKYDLENNVYYGDLKVNNDGTVDKGEGVPLDDSHLRIKTREEAQIVSDFTPVDGEDDVIARDRYIAPMQKILADLRKNNTEKETKILTKKAKDNLAVDRNNYHASSWNLNISTEDRQTKFETRVTRAVNIPGVTRGIAYTEEFLAAKDNVTNVTNSMDNVLTKNGALKSNVIKNLVESIDIGKFAAGKDKELFYDSEGNPTSLQANIDAYKATMNDTIRKEQLNRIGRFTKTLDVFADTMLDTQGDYVGEDGVRRYFEEKEETYQAKLIEKAGNDWNLLSDSQKSALFNKYKDARSKRVDRNKDEIKIVKYGFKEKVEEPVKKDKPVSREVLSGFGKKIDALLNNPATSDSDKADLLIMKNKAIEEADSLIVVENKIKEYMNGNISLEDFRVSLNSGIKKANGTIIQPATVRFKLKEQIDTFSALISKVDASTLEGKATLGKLFARLYKFQNGLEVGSTPPLFSKFNNITTNPSQIHTFNKNELHQFLAYVDYQSENNIGNKYGRIYKNKSAEIMKLAEKLEKDESMSEDKKFLSLKQYIATAGRWNISNSELKEKISKKLQSEIGEGAFTWDTDVQGDIANVLMELYEGTGSDKSISDFVNSFKKSGTYDINYNNVLFDDVRLIIPRGVDSVRFERALNRLRKEYDEDEIEYVPTIFDLSEHGYSQKVFGYQMKYGNRVLGDLHIKASFE